MKPYELVTIGGSAGSITALLQLLPELEESMQIPIIIIIHRKETDESALAELLATKTIKTVKEVDEKECITNGIIYLAPADYHLLIEKNKTFSLDFSEKINYSRPSIDVTFESAADVYQNKLIAILLSGANADGSEGLKKVKTAGGITIAQDPTTAEVSFMPEQAILHSKVDYVMNVSEIAMLLNKLAQQDP